MSWKKFHLLRLSLASLKILRRSTEDVHTWKKEMQTDQGSSNIKSIKNSLQEFTSRFATLEKTCTSICLWSSETMSTLENAGSTWTLNISRICCIIGTAVLSLEHFVHLLFFVLVQQGLCHILLKHVESTPSCTDSCIT